MSKYWKPLEKLTSWRKISVGMWDTPRDPQIYGHELLNVTETLRYLEEVSAVSGVNVTMTALLVKTFATAYEQFPALNVMVVNGRLQQRESIDAFCQVSIPNEKTGSADLSGIKITGANELDVVQLSQILRGRAARVRAGEDQEMEETKALIDKVPPWLMKRMLKTVDFLTYNVSADLDSLGVRSDPFGSFMISSIASFDLRLGYAPLVPASRVPAVALPGAVHDVVMPVDGEPAVVPGMFVGCTFDHRCFDGYQIGFIVRTARACMEHPYDHFPHPSFWKDRDLAAAPDPRAETERAG